MQQFYYARVVFYRCARMLHSTAVKHDYSERMSPHHARLKRPTERSAGS